MIGKASEIKTENLTVIGDVDEVINQWLSKNKDALIVDIKLVNRKETTTALIIFKEDDYLPTRPEVSI